MSRHGTNAGTWPITGRMVWLGPDGVIHDFSADQLNTRVGQIASGLYAAGVRSGDRVVGLMGRRPAALATALATMWLGAVHVPMLARWGEEVLAVRYAASSATYVVVDQAHRDLADILRPRPRVLVVSGEGRRGDARIDDLRLGKSTPRPAEVEADDVASLVYPFDGGSPDVAGEIRHRFVRTLQPFVDQAIAAEPGDLVLSTAHPSGTYGMFTTGIAPLVHGVSRAMLFTEFSVRSWLDGLATTGATHLVAAADGIERLAAAGPDLPERLRVVISTGRPMASSAVTWLQDAGAEVRQVWALEDAGPVLMNGRPLAGFTVRTADPSGATVAPGTPGALAVRDNGDLLVNAPTDAAGWRVSTQPAIEENDGRLRLLGTPR